MPLCPTDERAADRAVEAAARRTGRPRRAPRRPRRPACPRRSASSSRRLGSTRCPAGGRTVRTPGTGPPRVPSPVMVTGPVVPTSSANAVRSTHPPARVARRRTTPAIGSTLFGLARPVGVERSVAGEPGHRGRRREHQRHEVALLQADAVLARQHSTGGDRDAHDLFAGGVHTVHHPWLALVEHQQRVQVSVAGVEHVHHQQLVALDDLVDLSSTSGSRRRGTTVSCR